MLIISFDIATEKMFLLVENDDQILAICQEYSTPQKYNSALVIPELLKIFEKNNLTPKDINLIALNIGPGSFTGIRAGAVMARILGQFLNVPVVGIPSLEIYANACQSEKSKLIILDAKRSKWYTGIYNKDNQVIQEPLLFVKTDVIDLIKSNDYLIITEKNLYSQLEHYFPLIFEEFNCDFALILTNLAKEKVKKSANYKEDYAWYKLKPAYLQSPSITMPKIKL